MTTGQTIKKLRKEKGLSQQELAKLTGYTDRSSIAKIESDKCELLESKIKLFAAALNVTPADIMNLYRSEYDEKTISYNIVGDIAAGYERFAEYETNLGKIEIPVSWLRGHDVNDFFVLRISGDSMFPAYCDGDLILVYRQSAPDYFGQICVVNYDDNKATIKRVEYKPQQNQMRLVPINPQFPPIIVSGEKLDHCNILGIPNVIIRSVS